MGSGPAPPSRQNCTRRGRLQLAAEAAGAAGLGALLLTPGPDLRYVTGYDAQQLERLTCLGGARDGDPFLVVPRLELPAAQASPAGRFGPGDDPLGRDRRPVCSWSPAGSAWSPRWACPTGCGP